MEVDAGGTMEARRSAQVLLDRNQDIISTLIGLANLRAGRPITDVEERLAAEAFGNITQLTGMVPPKVLMGEKEGLEYFVTGARSLGMLPQSSDFPPAPEPEAAPMEVGGGGGGEGGEEGSTPSELFKDQTPEGTKASKAVCAVEMLFAEGSAEALSNGGKPAEDKPDVLAGDAAGGGGGGKAGAANGSSKSHKGPLANEDKGRITLHSRLPGAPPGCDVKALLSFHKLPDLRGVAFFRHSDVVDSDETPGTLNPKVFKFDIEDVAHGACFNLGCMGTDGTALISYSEMSAVYQMPDGSKWAQHADFLDLDDLTELARKKKLKEGHKKIMHPDFWEPFELVRKAGWNHTKLKEIEFENWVYRGYKFYKESVYKGGEVPPSGPESYFYRTVFDPRRWQVIEHLDE